MAIDILFINRIPFLICISEGLSFIHIRRLKSRSKSNIANALKLIKKQYNARGFSINVIKADNEFDTEDISTVFPSAIFEICAANEHVPIVERCIRTLKERCRSVCHSTPFNRYPVVMITQLVISCVRSINMFPPKDGISQSLSPSAIVEGKDFLDANVNRVPFGTYVLAYTGTDNTMKEHR